MIRRLTSFAFAGLAVTGCATFTDNDVVARVGDAELTADALGERLAGATDPTVGIDDPSGGDSADGDSSSDAAATPDRVAGDAARATVGEWIREQLVAESELAAQYTADPSSIGVACLDVAVAADVDEADALKQRLDAGEAWDDVVAPIEAAYGYESKQPCVTLVEYEQRFGADAAQAFGALKPGAAPEVIDTGDNGFVVMRAQDIADIALEDLVTVLSTLSTDGETPQVLADLIASSQDADVYVDPRLGAFDHERWVVDPVN